MPADWDIQKLHQSLAAQKLLGIVGDREGGLWTLEMDGRHQAAAAQRSIATTGGGAENSETLLQMQAVKSTSPGDS